MSKDILNDNMNKDTIMKPIPWMFGGYKGIHFHNTLLQDKIRTNSFKKAIFKTVKKGDVVLDLGSGLGILSFFAHNAGAKKIYSIEIEKHLIKTAKEIAKKNKMDDKIKFINKDSRLVELPEKVDVIVSECLGYFAIQGNMISAVIDARDRFLKKEGKVIPEEITMHIAPIQSFSHFRNINYWNMEKSYNIDLSPVQKLASNNIYLTTMNQKHFISTPKEIKKINMTNDHPNEMMNVKEKFSISEPCNFHGWCGWFDVNLCRGVSFSTSPLNKKTVWQQVFFPLEKEISLEKNCNVNIDLVLKRSDDDSCACLDWKTKINYHLSNKESIILKQSTKKSFPISRQNICNKKRCDVNIDGEIRNEKLKEKAKYAENQATSLKKR